MVGIYSLTSFIHNKEIIEKESRDFLNQIELNSNIVFHEVDSLDEEDLTLIFPLMQLKNY